jgi:hypothetical protein
LDFIKYEGYSLKFEIADFKNVQQTFDITLELTKNYQIIDGKTTWSPYTEPETVSITLLNDAPVILDPKDASINLFDGEVKTSSFTATDYEKSPYLQF